jgi:putative tryptophan/tyrosine transport system substrate-binding protein
VSLETLNAGSEAELDAAFPSLAQLHADALIIASDPFFYNERQRITALAARHSIPAIYELPEFAAIGGLISCGPNLAGSYRQAAGYVSRILRGAKPADLPVQQPIKFEPVINIKTAKELGIIIPTSLLAGAR